MSCLHRIVVVGLAGWLMVAATAAAEGSAPASVSAHDAAENDGAANDAASNDHDHDQTAKADSANPSYDTPADDRPPADDQALAFHVLNRLAFGPRPGQVQQLAASDWRDWARRQLRPDRIDDADTHAFIRRSCPSLLMSLDQTFEHYRPAYGKNPTAEDRERQRERRRALRRELRHAVLYRAAHSEAQLREVVVEFWRNHFNVDQNKDGVEWVANHYEQHVLRRYAFDRFDRLLLATAQHPAMLIYLDNHVSRKPLNAREVRLRDRLEQRKYLPDIVRRFRHRGLNENYARELLELHTLGVDNGYTQRDVTDLARVFTGWTVGEPRGDAMMGSSTYGFVYRDDLHDDDPKRVLDLQFRGGGGIDEGIAVIARLAHHPHTARFIAARLCRYFVADDPPDGLIDRVADVFDRTDGDLPSVYEAIIFSDAFTDPKHFGGKFKTPLEYVVSAVRATDAKAERPGELLAALERMGQDVYRCVDPTGYADTAEAWLDPGVLVYRWTFALRFAEAGVGDVRVPDAFLRPFRGRRGPALADAIASHLFADAIDTPTRAGLLDAVPADAGPRTALGILLGSPAFQRQ